MIIKLKGCKIAVYIFVCIFQKVTGENEADPVWGDFSPAFVSSSTPYEVREDVPIGTTVVTIQATDLDEGPDGLLTYSLTSVVNGKHSGSVSI